jgi:hypothetical protein
MPRSFFQAYFRKKTEKQPEIPSFFSKDAAEKLSPGIVRDFFGNTPKKTAFRG